MIEAGDNRPSGLPPVAASVDSEMVQISRAFDWLRAVSPCATQELWEDFQSSDCKGTPTFRYRDPGVDIASTRERLLGLPMQDIEEPVIKALLAEKQRELERQLELMELRGTPGFLQVSIDLFGVAAADLYADARRILDVVSPNRSADSQCVGADHVTEAALIQFAYYRRKCADFSAEVKRSGNITAGLMVSNNMLIVSEQARIPRERVDALLHHEIGTHILTWHNGGHQPLQQLQCGLAHYDELQEGLGVLAEYLAGNLSPLRLRTLAARVIAVRLVTDGAEFGDVFDALRSEFQFSGRSAFIIATRVFRGGGLTKDVVYLRGLKDLLAYLREGHPFEQLLVGKFSLSQLPAIKKLTAMGQLAPPKLLPAYLHNAAAQQRLAECTEVPLEGLYQRLVT
ncbi:MAG: tyrosine/phenylalanine carboxypeptidase domain-containing protein [Woeseia sp.]